MKYNLSTSFSRAYSRNHELTLELIVNPNRIVFFRREGLRQVSQKDRSLKKNAHR